MNETPRIAIIGGTGNLGRGLAKRWVTNGYRIIIGSRSEEKAQQVAAELNDELNLDTIRGMENSTAVKLSDFNVLTVIQSAHEKALRSLQGDLQGTILIDTTARIEYSNPSPPQPPSAARLAQNILGPAVPVFAAFQTVPAHALANLNQKISGDVFVCGDDPSLKEAVIGLVKGAGLNAYYVGDLDQAITIEGLTAMLISINKNTDINNASIQIIGER